MKRTKVTQDNTQTRSTIPKEYVDKMNVTNKDSVEWKIKKKKLVGELIKEDIIDCAIFIKDSGK